MCSLKISHTFDNYKLHKTFQGCVQGALLGKNCERHNCLEMEKACLRQFVTCIFENEARNMTFDL